MTRQYKKTKLKGDELTDTPTNRLKPNGLDEYYFDVAIDYPKLSQKEIMQKAMDNAGIEGTATKQHANKIHDRLRDRITQESEKAATDLKYLCVSELRNLIIKTESESVKLGAITLGTKDIFPNISVKQVKTVDDLDNAISDNIKQIAQDEGKTINQVLDELQGPTQH